MSLAPEGRSGSHSSSSWAKDPTRVMTGTVLEGAIIVNRSEVGLLDTTPVARLAEDYEVLVVPAASPYRTRPDFDVWRSDPQSHAIGGGAFGGTNHLLTGLVAREVGVHRQQINYIPYAGGGEVFTAILSGTVELGVSGYNEFRDQIETGNLRALSASAEKPVPGIDTPTLIEEGVEVSMPHSCLVTSSQRSSPKIKSVSTA